MATCRSGRIPFATKADAQAEADLQRVNVLWRSGCAGRGRKQKPYDCLICPAWHLSTASGARRKKMKKSCRNKRGKFILNHGLDEV